MPDSAQLEKFVVCPSCKGELKVVRTDVQCVECEQIYPQISKRLYALFCAPNQAIATAYLGFHAAIESLQSQETSLAKAIKESERKRELLPLLKALHDNQTFFLRWRSQLDSCVDIPTLLKRATSSRNRRQGYGFNYSYLNRDWSTDTDTQGRFQHLMQALRAALESTDGNHPGDLLVLGAGAGRVAVELAGHSQSVWAVDSSLGQTACFNDLLDGPIENWEINTRNQRRDNSMIKKHRPEIPAHLQAAATQVRYLWADALNSPFRNRSLNMILSVFFSDVKPLPLLLEELKRLLAPGGYFIHVGPLQYHFKDLTQHYSYASFVRYFEHHGFDIVYECEQTPLPHCGEDLSFVRDFTSKIMVARYSGSMRDHHNG